MFGRRRKRAVSIKTQTEILANKDIEEYKEIKKIILTLIIESSDREFKEKMLKIYDYINKPRIYFNGGVKNDEG